MKRIVLSAVTGGLVAAAGYLATPSTAQACGGTFCDGGPVPMPVDQSGENILFIRDGDYVEAHIQIQYQGNAERFGWVIPLQGLPEFQVGSDPLFQALLAGSVPTYTQQSTFDDCSFDDGGDDGDGGNAGAGEDGADGGGDTGGGGVDVVFQETVGTFEIAVLSGGNAQEVVDWLVANDYQSDDNAVPILQEYIDEGHLFGAVKLTSGADTDEIHPIVLRFQSSEPCIPLRLTRIAATDDMDVRTFFLGDSRVVPKSYKHVLVNPLKLDWLNFADNYKEVISMAVDQDMANGRAFVTEYAGDSSVVNQTTILGPGWDAAPFATAEPIEVIDLLEQQGLYLCDLDFGNGCGGLHALVQPILDEFLPVPAGVDHDDFYSCLSCYEDQIDLTVWNAMEFAATLDERVVAPAEHAVDLLNSFPYLTRMYTTISPNEMMEDPMFHENPDLPDVAAFQTGTRRFLCTGDSVFTLPDGREVFLPAGTSDWPDFTQEPAWEQPWDEDIQEVMTQGAPISLVNKTEEIDEALAAYNAFYGWPGGGGGADGGGADGADDGADGGGTGGSDGGADGGMGEDGGMGAGNGEGCGCTTGRSGPVGFLWMLTFGLGWLGSRRRS